MTVSHCGVGTSLTSGQLSSILIARCSVEASIGILWRQNYHQRLFLYIKKIVSFFISLMMMSKKQLKSVSFEV